MIIRQTGDLMPHELPHESPDHHDSLLEGLPKLAEKNSGPLDKAPAALSASLKSDIETRSQRLHVYNDGEVCVDIVLFYKAWGDGKKVIVTFMPTGRIHKGAAPPSKEQFLLDRPVPTDLLRHIRGHIGGFDGAAGEAFLYESIQKTLDYYHSNQEAWERLTYEEVDAYWAAVRRDAGERLARQRGN